MEYWPAPNMEWDFLNFDDDASMDTGTGTLSEMTSINFDQNTTFQDPNAALNSMFKTGLTPLSFPNGIPNTVRQFNSWSNLGSLNEPYGYFPEVPPDGQTAIAPIVVESPESIDYATPSAASEASELLVKPKRGRPRKSRAKKQLSPQQEYEKRQRFLERNRQAASKCRERRKTWISKQEERMNQEQAKNAELKAECDILNQEVYNLLQILHQHAESGCNKDQLQAFLRSESILGLASSKVSGSLVRRYSNTSTSSMGQDSVQGSSATHKPGEMSRESSQGSDEKGSAITSMESPVWQTDEAAKDDEYMDSGKMLVMSNSRASRPQVNIVNQAQPFDPLVCPAVSQAVPADGVEPSIYLQGTSFNTAVVC
ncbi:hypothetical protein B0O99DRAFT_93627 [Bisporella sp. PMI_857]|nr:hypothetical protein B0O99DRAFT_93627 [Bisporella sp. PMI_857]